MGGKDLLTTAEVAEILGVSMRRVREFCVKEKIGQKIGTQLLITRAELERFKARQRRPGRPKKTDR